MNDVQFLDANSLDVIISDTTKNFTVYRSVKTTFDG